MDISPQNRRSYGDKDNWRLQANLFSKWPTEADATWYISAEGWLHFFSFLNNPRAPLSQTYQHRCHRHYRYLWLFCLENRVSLQRCLHLSPPRAVRILCRYILQVYTMWLWWQGRLDGDGWIIIHWSHNLTLEWYFVIPSHHLCMNATDIIMDSFPQKENADSSSASFIYLYV